MKDKFINPNEYGSLLYDESEKQYLNEVINQRRIFRYSRCDKPYTTMCEEKIKEIVNIDFCLMTSNGTSGLKTALVGAGIKKGDRVLISSYTFLATALAPIALGAIPIPIDIDLNTGLNLQDLEEEIKKGCKAIIVVHFQGRTFDLSEVKRIANENKIVLIEDACQAFCANINGKYAGTIGDIGVYSFQQFKQLSCGEGGAVVTNNENIYNKMRNYTDMGSVRNGFPTWNGESSLFGENYRMNHLNAAVLYAQLEKKDRIINKQKDSRKRIMSTLKKKKVKNIIESKDPLGDTSMNILILLNDKLLKEDAINLARQKRIELRNMWSSVYYQNDLFAKNNLTALSLKNRECTKTLEMIDRLLVISIPPILSSRDEQDICDLILELKLKNYME